MAHAPRGRFSFGTSDMRKETDVQETNLQVRPTTGRGWESGVRRSCSEEREQDSEVSAVGHTVTV